jgi:hypothetical protein
MAMTLFILDGSILLTSMILGYLVLVNIYDTEMVFTTLYFQSSTMLGHFVLVNRYGDGCFWLTPTRLGYLLQVITYDAALVGSSYIYDAGVYGTI